MTLDKDEYRIGGAKLTESTVRVIKMKLNQGFSVKMMAQAYGVGKETIARIKRGDTWSWVRPDAQPELIEKLSHESERMIQKRLKAMGEQAGIEQEKYKKEEVSEETKKMFAAFNGKGTAKEEEAKRRERMMEAAAKLGAKVHKFVGVHGEEEVPLAIEGHVNLDELGGNPMDMQVNPGECDE